jgi:hypothetical protein
MHKMKRFFKAAAVASLAFLASRVSAKAALFTLLGVGGGVTFRFSSVV